METEFVNKEGFLITNCLGAPIKFNFGNFLLLSKAFENLFNFAFKTYPINSSNLTRIKVTLKKS
jgi:hypothetical protein